jgi:hypothetical protein
MEGTINKSFHNRGESLKDIFISFIFVEQEQHPEPGYFYRRNCEHYVT